MEAGETGVELDTGAELVDTGETGVELDAGAELVDAAGELLDDGA